MLEKVLPPLVPAIVVVVFGPAIAWIVAKLDRVSQATRRADLMLKRVELLRKWADLKALPGVSPGVAETAEQESAALIAQLDADRPSPPVRRVKSGKAGPVRQFLLLDPSPSVFSWLTAWGAYYFTASALYNFYRGVDFLWTAWRAIGISPAADDAIFRITKVLATVWLGAAVFYMVIAACCWWGSRRMRDDPV